MEKGRLFVEKKSPVKKRMSMMAANFTIDKHRSNDTLEIVLKGDLDGSSAWAVIHEIKKIGAGIDDQEVRRHC